MRPGKGTLTPREAGRQIIARSRARAALIPDLLVEANRVANNVHSGWHGRRKRGIGENFWQFRQYTPGENYASIDWRRSAREDCLFVKDREWQATHCIWIWVDESKSMLFKSDTAQVSKQSRGLVIAFALAELLARTSERIGWLGLTKPIMSRNAAERLAQALMNSEPQTTLPCANSACNHTDLILISDFLDPLDETIKQIHRMSENGGRGHLVQIVDPVEDIFPYSGRVEFDDPETGIRFTSGSAQSLRTQYRDMIQARNNVLRNAATKLGWSHTIHHTNRLASEALMAVHSHMSGGDLVNAATTGVEANRR